MEQSYKPFARKYRPKNLYDIVAQREVVETINNSIKFGRLPQVYLFTGIRGIGKTTLARIIASTINCISPVESNGILTPCESCNNCLAFRAEKHPDVVEMDAASNTSVDDVRGIILDSVGYKPILGKYKVFILDEAHMLSKSAFNALLKVFEEPPPYVIFILATTEIYKIPPTINSRCQEFSLKRFDNNDIASLLKNVCSKENIEFEEEAINAIAAKSQGSARDALTLLDKAYSFSLGGGGKITKNITEEITGIVDLGCVIDYMEHILNGNVGEALKVLEARVYKKSMDITYFFHQLLDLIALLMKKKAEIEGKYGTYKEDIERLSKLASISYLTTLWQFFTKGIIELKGAHNLFTYSEVLTIKAVFLTKLPSLDDIILKLKSESDVEASRPNDYVNSSNQKKNDLVEKVVLDTKPEAFGIKEPISKFREEVSNENLTEQQFSKKALESYENESNENNILENKSLNNKDLKVIQLKENATEIETEKEGFLKHEEYKLDEKKHANKSSRINSQEEEVFNLDSAGNVNDNKFSKNIDKNSIIELSFMGFLHYLHKIKNFKIYTPLTNEFEVEEFEKENLVLKGAKENHEWKNELKNTLFDWTSKNWNVIIKPSSNYKPLKEQLIEEFKSNNTWNEISKKFKSAVIENVILDKNLK